MSNPAAENTAEDASPGFKRLPGGTYQAVCNVDAIFTNINLALDFRFVRAKTDESIRKAILQVVKHISCGIYKVVSLHASERMLVVTIDGTATRRVDV